MNIAYLPLWEKIKAKQKNYLFSGYVNIPEKSGTPYWWTPQANQNKRKLLKIPINYIYIVRSKKKKTCVLTGECPYGVHLDNIRLENSVLPKIVNGDSRYLRYSSGESNKAEDYVFNFFFFFVCESTLKCNGLQRSNLWFSHGILGLV